MKLEPIAGSAVGSKRKKPPKPAPLNLKVISEEHKDHKNMIAMQATEMGMHTDSEEVSDLYILLNATSTHEGAISQVLMDNQSKFPEIVLSSRSEKITSESSREHNTKRDFGALVNALKVGKYELGISLYRVLFGIEAPTEDQLIQYLENIEKITKFHQYKNSLHQLDIQHMNKLASSLDFLSSKYYTKACHESQPPEFMIELAREARKAFRSGLVSNKISSNTLLYYKTVNLKSTIFHVLQILSLIYMYIWITSGFCSYYFLEDVSTGDNKECSTLWGFSAMFGMVVVNGIILEIIASLIMTGKVCNTEEKTFFLRCRIPCLPKDIWGLFVNITRRYNVLFDLAFIAKTYFCEDNKLGEVSLIIFCLGHLIYLLFFQLKFLFHNKCKCCKGVEKLGGFLALGSFSVAGLRIEEKLGNRRKYEHKRALHAGWRILTMHIPQTVLQITYLVIYGANKFWEDNIVYMSIILSIWSGLVCLFTGLNEIEKNALLNTQTHTRYSAIGQKYLVRGRYPQSCNFLSLAHTYFVLGGYTYTLPYIRLLEHLTRAYMGLYNETSFFGDKNRAIDYCEEGIRISRKLLTKNHTIIIKLKDILSTIENGNFVDEFDKQPIVQARKDNGISQMLYLYGKDRSGWTPLQRCVLIDHDYEEGVKIYTQMFKHKITHVITNYDIINYKDLLLQIIYDYQYRGELRNLDINEVKKLTEDLALLYNRGYIMGGDVEGEPPEWTYLNQLCEQLSKHDSISASDLTLGAIQYLGNKSEILGEWYIVNFIMFFLFWGFVLLAPRIFLKGVQSNDCSVDWPYFIIVPSGILVASFGFEYFLIRELCHLRLTQISQNFTPLQAFILIMTGIISKLDTSIDSTFIYLGMYCDYSSLSLLSLFTFLNSYLLIFIFIIYYSVRRNNSCSLLNLNIMSYLNDFYYCAMGMSRCLGRQTEFLELFVGVRVFKTFTEDIPQLVLVSQYIREMDMSSDGIQVCILSLVLNSLSVFSTLFVYYYWREYLEMYNYAKEEIDNKLHIVREQISHGQLASAFHSLNYIKQKIQPIISDKPEIYAELCLEKARAHMKARSKMRKIDDRGVAIREAQTAYNLLMHKYGKTGGLLAKASNTLGKIYSTNVSTYEESLNSFKNTQMSLALSPWNIHYLSSKYLESKILYKISIKSGSPSLELCIWSLEPLKALDPGNTKKMQYLCAKFVCWLGVVNKKEGRYKEAVAWLNLGIALGETLGDFKNEYMNKIYLELAKSWGKLGGREAMNIPLMKIMEFERGITVTDAGIAILLADAHLLKNKYGEEEAYFENINRERVEIEIMEKYYGIGHRLMMEEKTRYFATLTLALHWKRLSSLARQQKDFIRAFEMIKRALHYLQDTLPTSHHILNSFDETMRDFGRWFAYTPNQPLLIPNNTSPNIILSPSSPYVSLEIRRWQAQQELELYSRVECMGEGCHALVEGREMLTHMQSCLYVLHHCRFRGNGCEEVLPLRDMGRHLGDCLYSAYLCQSCGVSMLRQEALSHGRICQGFMVDCGICGVTLTRGEFALHMCAKGTLESRIRGLERDKLERRQFIEEYTAQLDVLKGKFTVLEEQNSVLRRENVGFIGGREQVVNMEIAQLESRDETGLVRKIEGVYGKAKMHTMIEGMLANAIGDAVADFKCYFCSKFKDIGVLNNKIGGLYICDQCSVSTQLNLCILVYFI